MAGPLSFAPRRELGRTGFRATQLGIGDLADRSLSLEVCVATLRRALDFGLNVVDTAPSYENGHSEQIVGQALRGRREGIFVIDKVDHLGRPLEDRPRGKLSSGGKAAEGVPELPHLTVEECVNYTLTCEPDVALLGMSFPNEQDAAFGAARDFQPLSAAALADVRRRATLAMAGKGRTWWNPE